MMDYIQMDAQDVQDFLDTVVAGEEIHVRFLKQNGEVSTYNGTLDVGAARKESVAIYTEEGWKRFNINRVIKIERVE